MCTAIQAVCLISANLLYTQSFLVGVLDGVGLCFFHKLLRICKRKKIAFFNTYTEKRNMRIICLLSYSVRAAVLSFRFVDAVHTVSVSQMKMMRLLFVSSWGRGGRNKKNKKTEGRKEVVFD